MGPEASLEAGAWKQPLQGRVPEVIAPFVLFSLTPEQMVIEFSLLVTMDGSRPTNSTVVSICQAPPADINSWRESFLLFPKPAVLHTGAIEAHHLQNVQPYLCPIQFATTTHRDPQPQSNRPTHSSLLLAQNLAPNTVGNSPPILPAASLLSLHETFSEPMPMWQELTWSHLIQQPGRWPLSPLVDEEATIKPMYRRLRPVRALSWPSHYSVLPPGEGHKLERPRPALRSTYLVTKNGVTCLFAWTEILGCLG